MVLGERSKVWIRGIKGKFEERERDFWGHWNILGKKKKGKEPERREKGRTNHSQKPTSFGEKEEDLAFQRVLTLKSSLRVKLGAH